MDRWMDGHLQQLAIMMKDFFSAHTVTITRENGSEAV